MAMRGEMESVEPTWRTMRAGEEGELHTAPDRPLSPPQAQDDLRRLRRLLEARQRQLRARIAACGELTAEMAALQAALRPGSTGPGEGPVPGPPSALNRGEGRVGP